MKSLIAAICVAALPNLGGAESLKTIFVDVTNETTIDGYLWLKRPVIVFEDIQHIIGNKKGIFVSKRNFINFFGTLNSIKKNYKKIQKDMKKNKLPTNKEFIDKFVKYIDDFN